MDHIYQLAHPTISSSAHVQVNRRPLSGCSMRPVLLNFAHVHVLNREYTVIIYIRGKIHSRSTPTQSHTYHRSCL